MPIQGVDFAGSFLALPGAYYADNVTAAGPDTPPVTPPMVVLGYGWGQKPQTAVTYINTANWQAAMRGAPIVNYIPFIANPSPNLNGAQYVTFIDCSRNTQSSAVLLTSGAGTYATLTSALYGPPSNQLTYAVNYTNRASTLAANLVLTDNYANVQYNGLNLGVPFDLSYVGAATGGLSYTCTPASGTFKLTSPNAGETVTFSIGSGGYTPVSTLVEAINGTGFWTANLISSTNGQLPSLSLDAGNPTVATGVANPVLATQNDLVYWVSQFCSSIVTAVTGSAASGGAGVPASGTPTFFSGATGVPPITSDYASGFAVALANPGWVIWADSNSSAVQALMASHCEIASSPPYGMWRRGFTGSSIGDTVATTTATAIGLDSLQMVYAYPGIYKTNTSTGVNQLYGGNYVAAAAAGIAAGNIVALPLTNKVLNGTGVEAANAGAPLTQSQLSTLQNAGVMALWTTTQQNGPPTILSDMTTWQVDDNVENTSSQQVACRYWLAYSVVSTLRQYVGTIASPTTEVNILNALVKLFNALIYTGGSSNGVLASWDQKSLVLTYSGTQQLASVTVNVTLVGQNKFITCYASIQPLNFSIAAGA